MWKLTKLYSKLQKIKITDWKPETLQFKILNPEVNIDEDDQEETKENTISYPIREPRLITDFNATFKTQGLIEGSTIMIIGG